MVVMNGLFIATLLCLLAATGSGAAKNVGKQKEKALGSESNAFCENLMSAFFVSDNTNVAFNASAMVRNISESGCLDLCTNNRDPKGRLVFCASVVYDRDRSHCSMYRKSSEPDGELERRPEDGKRYFEKFCLAEDVPLDCANKQFVRVDDYILKGYAQATAVFPTMAECVAHCIREREFECRSAMYFYEEGECITNLESAITRPDDFQKPDDDDKVVFFHNGCIQPASLAATEIAASQDEERGAAGGGDSSASEEVASEDREVEPSISRESGGTPLPPNPPSTQRVGEVGGKEEELIDSPSTTESTSTRSSRTSTTSAPSTTTEDAAQGSSTPSKHQPEATTEPEEELPRKSSSAAPPRSNRPQEESAVRLDEDQAPPVKIPKIPARTIETRLYGAKQLETLSDGSLQEKRVEQLSQEEPPHSSFTTDSAPSFLRQNSSGSVEDQEGGLLPPPPLAASSSASQAPRALMPMMERAKETLPAPHRHEPTKQLPLKPLKTDKSNRADQKGDPEEDGYFGKWGEWTACRQAGERRIRRRKCLDLRRCKGALMQVDYCPKDLQEQGSELTEAQSPEVATTTADSPVGPVRQPLPINQVPQTSSAGAPPSILPPHLPQKELKPLPVGAPGKAEDVWSPWLGTCQHFASNQPCKNNEMIGFESRECIAKDPKSCKGPFFRYCTISC